jgi:hypothetical protein
MDLDLAVRTTRRAPANDVALVANTPAEPLLEWIFVEQGFDREQLAIYTPKRILGSCDRFLDWVARSNADTLLFLEISRASPWYAAPFPSYEALRGCIREQQTFQASGTPRSPAPGAWVTRFERSAQ